MENISQLSIRERYIQLSKKILNAMEGGWPEEEIQKLCHELKQMEPLLLHIESSDAPDLP
jgi:hypothetical protein